MSLPHSYRLNLHLLTPVHIGNGQELDPFTYIIRDNGLFLIDLIKWIASFPQQDELRKMMDTDNFARVRSFMAAHFDAPDAVRAAIPIDNPQLTETYHKAIRAQNPRNQVLISQMVRNEVNMESYLPGSSIKGAIRTAIANRFVKPARVSSADSYRNKYNSKIFGPPQQDPLKFLKLGDVPLGKNGTVIVEAKEFPLNPDKPLTPKGHVEVTFSLCHTNQPVILPLRLNLRPFSLHGTKIDLGFLADALYRFYVPKYEQEYSKFYKGKKARAVRQGIARMNRAVAGLRSNEALIRIGHFSHVECITLDGVRQPKTRLGKDRKPLPWGVTRTLANGIYPFGWAKLEFIDLPSKPRPVKKWPFPSEETDEREYKEIKNRFASPPVFMPKHSMTPPVSPQNEKQPSDDAHKPVKRTSDTPSPLEKLLKQLDLIKSIDMGRIGTVISMIETLENNSDKAVIAKAIRNKISPKAFKKHKQKEYLLKLMALVE